MRLVTRGDLDGLTSAVLVSTMEEIESIELIHPQDITDQKFEIEKNDVMANLPYHPNCAMWFDHHLLTKSNQKPPENFKGKHSLAPSTARVIYDYYASDDLKRYEYLVQETDRLDSAQLTPEDILFPEGVILLGFTIDGRTGIARFKEYFMNLVEWVKNIPIDEVLKKPEVAVRVRFLKDENIAFRKILKENSRLDEKIIITDFRFIDEVPVGNRFLVFTLFPEANISLRLQWGPQKSFVAASLGHSVINRTSKANCGEICAYFGGGGHRGAGSTPLSREHIDEKINQMIHLIKKTG